jgi:DNA-binding HxlR family transcriptional regulator
MSVANTDVSAVLEPCGLPDHEDCGLRDVLDRLGERWTVMAVAELAQGPQRFRQLERALDGISQRMLTLTVRRLERDGMVSRTVEPTIPPAVTYQLTPLGSEFAKMVVYLVDWSKSYKEQIAQARLDFDTE